MDIRKFQKGHEEDRKQIKLLTAEKQKLNQKLEILLEENIANLAKMLLDDEMARNVVRRELAKEKSVRDNRREHVEVKRNHKTKRYRQDTESEESDWFVGHVPIEISRIINYFMQNNEKNFVSATVVGPRKREIRLAVPAKFSAYAADRRVADILSKQILKIKTKYSHFDLEYEEDKKLCKRPYLLEKEKS